MNLRLFYHLSSAPSSTISWETSILNPSASKQTSPTTRTICSWASQASFTSQLKHLWQRNWNGGLNVNTSLDQNTQLCHPEVTPSSPKCQFCFWNKTRFLWASQVAQWSRTCLPMQETQVQSLGREDPLKEGTATHSSIQYSPVFLPGESHGQRSLAGYSPWAGKETDTTERLNSNKIFPSQHELHS